MNRIVPLLLAGLAAGCGLQQQRSQEYLDRDVLDTPVLRPGNAMLSEEAIRLLLTTRVAVPEKAKLAVAALDHRSLKAERYGQAAEFLERRKEFLAAIENPLRETGRFVEIVHVPSLLIEKEPSLVRLREAAALMQANLLLVYQIRTQLIYDAHVFSKDEVKSQGAIDVLLVDVKTGAIPYTDTFEATQVEKEQKGDADTFETRKRADHLVSLQAVKLAVDGLKGFFAGTLAERSKASR